MFLSHYHHHHHLLFSNLPVPLTLTHHHSSFSHPPPSHLVHFLHRPTIIPHTVSAITPTLSSWLTELTTGTDDPSSTIQVTSTILVTGAITLFFFRTLQRRAKRAKELKFRSSGVNKSLASTSIKAKKRPSPDQALLGAIIAGVIAVILYRFTTSVEATLYRQTISDNFSVRQVTITIRTIINGLCYLATFVYGINSVGLLLYSGQLAMNTFEGGPSGKETEKRILEQSGSSNSSTDQLSSTKEDENSNNSQQ